jgi:hypothetical protein
MIKTTMIVDDMNISCFLRFMNTRLLSIDLKSSWLLNSKSGVFFHLIVVGGSALHPEHVLS